MRCLLIDDRIEEHRIFANALELTNLDVNCDYETSALKAFEKLCVASNEELPKIIFLDIYMPGMDGKKFLQKIKQDDRLKKIPVYVYTSSTNDADINELIKTGAVFYIMKTSNIEGLAKALQVLLNRLDS